VTNTTIIEIQSVPADSVDVESILRIIRVGDHVPCPSEAREALHSKRSKSATMRRTVHFLAEMCREATTANGFRGPCLQWFLRVLGSTYRVTFHHKLCCIARVGSHASTLKPRNPASPDNKPIHETHNLNRLTLALTETPCNTRTRMSKA
jgi:hypothetical protein